MTAFITTSNVAGDGLFVDRAVDAGARLWTRERPSFAALDTQRLAEACSNCFKWNPVGQGRIDHSSGSIDMKVCTGCKTLRYCSKECQAKSWSEHKKECKLLGELASKGFLPNAARLVLNMLMSFATMGSPPLQNLQSALPKIASAGGARYETLQFLSMGLHEYTGKKVDVEFFRLCFGLIYTNALTVNTPAFDPLGICVDDFMAKANHSCDPNTFLVFDGPRMSLRALKPISKGEEIFISYVDHTNPYHRRQSELLDRYYFNCTCSKCIHGATLPEDDFLTKHVSVDMEEKETVPFAKLAEAKGEQDPSKSLKLLQEGLQACLETKVWPERRQPLPSLRHEAFVTLLSEERWISAFRQGLTLYFDVYPSLYPEPFHPLRVVQKWTLSKLALFLADQRETDTVSQLDQAGLDLGIVVVGLLTEVLDNVRLSHGPKHSFAHEVKTKYEEVIVDMSRGDEKLQFMKDKMPAQWDLLRRFASSKEVNVFTS